MSPMRDGTNKQTTSEDSATQLLIWETLSLATVSNQYHRLDNNLQISLLKALLLIQTTPLSDVVIKPL